MPPEMSQPALTSRVFEDPADLEPYWGEWDGLAVEGSEPLASPAWGMAWWNHLRPRNVALRVVLVWAGERLVGVVPLCASGRRYRPLAYGLPGMGPLAKPDQVRGVALQAAISLAEAERAPASIELELRSGSPDWVALLRESWPAGRRPRSWVVAREPVPRIVLDDGFDAWMASRSGKFRREAQNKRNRLEKAGASFRYATAVTLEGDVRTFLRLHRVRLSGRGGTSLTDEGVERMLIAAGSELLPSKRFGMLLIELDGKPIAARVLLAAGREVLTWNSGFDEDFARLSPSLQGLLRAVADAASGEDGLVFSLGPGGQSYKYRLSNDEETLTSSVLLPPGARYPLARARLGREQLRRALADRLPAGLKARLRAAAARLRPR
jgi:CelD/BcsL family acetyltransferase involved in cellulose biosynthesis